MKQLGRAKRQKSQAPLGDVETPGSNEVSQG
jgi:putative transposase